MIFRNSIRLLLTNFSTVWKVLVYYLICFTVTIGVCYLLAEPIVQKLTQANIFEDAIAIINNIFSSNPTTTAYTASELLSKAWTIIITNFQFKFNFIFLIIWLVFAFPYLLNLCQLAMGDLLYGYMTSQVKYSFSGRMIINLGRSAVFSLVRFVVMLAFNLVSIGLFVLSVSLAITGVISNILLALGVLTLLICFVAFKQTLFSCWMPALAVLGVNPFKALKRNFKAVFQNFFAVYSNFLLLCFLTVVVNLFCCVFTASISLIITLPLTVFAFSVFQMVTYFTSQGMRFYVYPDLFISPKHFEEQDKIKRIKNLL
ncbi:MAG: hypothetical protein EOM55_01310 [Clostridia bacterium]|nr:hypothetical protein [Clostridia bacterium]